ncbi:MAG TPA: alpha/beta hydrolase [Stellaceae bacterium]|nr:alpha/beta hydrolase [Stellaceae bacterium]
MRLWGLILALPCLLAGCSTSDLVNAFAPRDDFRLVAGLAYGDNPRQTLDLYLPVGAQGKRPVVVFFYGGNWDSGHKEDYLFLGEALASRGFIVVVPDYRIYPEIRYPAFLADGADAVRWTWSHIAEQGGDPAHVSLMGHSAGAYNAMMLALDPKWLGDARQRIASVVGLAGPYDFLPLVDPTLKIIFATEPDLPRTQPIAYVDGAAPPVLLVSGRLDTIVSPGNVTRLAARIREHGGRVETEFYSLLGHITLIGSFARPLRFVTPVLDDVTRFLEAPYPAT